LHTLFGAKCDKHKKHSDYFDFYIAPSLVPVSRLSFGEYDFNFLRSTERTEFYKELF